MKFKKSEEIKAFEEEFGKLANEMCEISDQKIKNELLENAINMAKKCNEFGLSHDEIMCEIHNYAYCYIPYRFQHHCNYIYEELENVVKNFVTDKNSKHASYQQEELEKLKSMLANTTKISEIQEITSKFFNQEEVGEELSTNQIADKIDDIHKDLANWNISLARHS